MADKLTLICDQCGLYSETPTQGWIAIRPARKSETVSQPPAKADFCGVPCLTTYVARMSFQVSLDSAISDASQALELPLPDEEQDGAAS